MIPDSPTSPEPRRRSRFVFLVLFLLLAFVPLLFMTLGEALSLQQCTEAGGSFDYERMVCDFDARHSAPPFAERHRGLLVGTGIAAMTAVVLWRWGAALGRG